MLHEIIPVVLCGGAGKRLWPLSRKSCPKPFLKLGRPLSMLQETLLRVQACSAPVLVLNRALKSRAMNDLERIGVTPRKIILETTGRNTAPALAAAAFLVKDHMLLVLPSDHAIGNPDILMRAVEMAIPLAKTGCVISFGIKPKSAKTGFGYIRRGPVVATGVFRIDSFIEKPPRKIAKSLLRSGDCDWNSGIFLLSAETATRELKKFEPSLFAIVESAIRDTKFENHVAELGDVFSQAPALSIDVALMERSDKTLVVPIGLDWCDLGSWPAFLRHFFRLSRATALPVRRTILYPEKEF